MIGTLFEKPTEAEKVSIAAVQAILDARALFSNESLTKLYDPNKTPHQLADAHKVLDNAVKKAYGSKGFVSKAESCRFDGTISSFIRNKVEARQAIRKA